MTRGLITCLSRYTIKLYRIVLPLQLVASRPKVYKMKDIFTGELLVAQTVYPGHWNSIHCLQWLGMWIECENAAKILCIVLSVTDFIQISSSAMNLWSTIHEGLQGGPSLDTHSCIQFFKCLNYRVTWLACDQSARHLNSNPDRPVCLSTVSLVTCPMTEWLRVYTFVLIYQGPLAYIRTIT